MIEMALGGLPRSLDPGEVGSALETIGAALTAAAEGLAEGDRQRRA